MNDNNEILRKAKEALEEAVNEARKNRSFVSNIGSSIIAVLSPILDKIADNSRMTKDEIKETISQIHIDIPPIDVPHTTVDVKIPEIKVPPPQVTVTVPEIKIPEIKLPIIKVPTPEVTVNVPPIKIPHLEIPKFDFPNDIEVSLKKEFDYKNPLPVILMDDKGNPYLAVGGSGGLGPRVIQDILTAQGRSIMDEANSAARVNIVAGSTSGTQYNDTATPDQSGGTGTLAMLFDGSSTRSVRGTSYGIPTVQLSGFDGSLIGITSNALDINIKSGSVVGITNSVAASLIDSSGIQYSGSNPVPVVGPIVVTSITNSAATALVDSTGVQYSGSNPIPIVGPVVVTSITNSSASALIDSTGVQYSGSNPLPIVGPVVVTNITNSIAAAVVDSTGVAYSGSNPLPIVGPIVVTSITNSIAASLIDSTGVAFEGANPLPANIAQVGGTATLTGFGVTGAGAQRIVVGSDTTVMVVGLDAVRTVNTNHPPLKVGGVVNLTNPTAYTDGQIANFSADKYGRQLVTPYQVRDLVVTAYATLTTGTEATLLAGVAGTNLDLVYVGCSTDSVVAAGANPGAITVDIREVRTGGIVATINVPYDSIAGFAPSVPFPQSEAGSSWTVDLNDITGTNAFVSALFIKN